MNGTNAIVSKKVMPLVAVLILCAACLVTVAYAYNASYQDTIEGEQVPVEETSKYIYITGSGLSYPNAEKFKATTSVQYDTVTTSQGITATPTDFEITGRIPREQHAHLTGLLAAEVLSALQDTKAELFLLSESGQKKYHTDCSLLVRAAGLHYILKFDWYG